MHQISAVSTVNGLMFPIQISRTCRDLSASDTPLDFFSSFTQETSPLASQSLQTRLTVRKRPDENRWEPKSATGVFHIRVFHLLSSAAVDRQDSRLATTGYVEMLARRPTKPVGACRYNSLIPLLRRQERKQCIFRI